MAFNAKTVSNTAKLSIFNILAALPLLYLIPACERPGQEIVNKRSIPDRYVPGSFVVNFDSDREIEKLNEMTKTVSEEIDCAISDPEEIKWSSGQQSAVSEEAFKTLSIKFEGCDLDRSKTESVLSKLSEIDGVILAEAEAMVDATPIDADPLRERQRYLDMINRDKACDLTGENQKVIKVAILDTGIDLNHRDLKDVILKDESGELVMANFVGKGARGDHDAEVTDGTGHGTHVAGIIAATAGNDRGIVGVASCMNVKIIPVRVLNDQGSGTNIEIQRGIQWAVDQGAQIINLSLGYDTTFKTIRSSTFKNWFYKRLADRNVMVFAAAGNEGFVNGSDEGEGKRFSFPASFDNVISVAATDTRGNLTNFSVRGERVDIAAPGLRIMSTYKGGGYALLSGTSMATPVAAGAYALALAHVVDRLGALDRIEVGSAEESIESAILPRISFEKSVVESQGVLDVKSLVSIIDSKYPLTPGNNTDDEGYVDNGTDTRPDTGGDTEVDDDTGDHPNIPADPVEVLSLAFEGLIEGQDVSGFQYVKLDHVPAKAKLVAVFWGEMKTPFVILKVKSGQSSVKSASRWYFQGTHKLRAYAVDSYGRILGKTALLLQGAN